MNNFETKNLLERDAYSEEVLNKLHQKAEKKVEPYRPDPNDFREVYGNEVVDADIAEVARLESKFQEQMENLSDHEKSRQEVKHKIAYIAECLIADQLSGNWLGNRATAMPASKFDDYKHGVDMVIHFPEEESDHKYLGLGIDITTSKDENDIVKKLDRILKNNVLGDKKSEIKYFESEDEKKTIGVPRVIIALQDDQIKSLFTLEDRSNKEGLANHNAQLIILYQLQQQCTTFFNIAEKVGNENATQMYGRAQRIITDIIQEKTELFDAHPTLLNEDPATMAIWQYCADKESEMNIGEVSEQVSIAA